LHICRALLRIHRALLRIIRARLWIYLDPVRICRALVRIDINISIDMYARLDMQVALRDMYTHTHIHTRTRIRTRTRTHKHTHTHTHTHTQRALLTREVPDTSMLCYTGV